MAVTPARVSANYDYLIKLLLSAIPAGTFCYGGRRCPFYGGRRYDALIHFAGFKAVGFTHVSRTKLYIHHWRWEAPKMAAMRKLDTLISTVGDVRYMRATDDSESARNAINKYRPSCFFSSDSDPLIWIPPEPETWKTTLTVLLIMTTMITTMMVQNGSTIFFGYS